MWRDSRARLHIATTIRENHHWRLAVSCQGQRSRGFAIRGDTETDSQSHNIGGDPEEHPVNLGAKRVQENKTWNMYIGRLALSPVLCCSTQHLLLILQVMIVVVEDWTRLLNISKPIAIVLMCAPGNLTIICWPSVEKDRFTSSLSQRRLNLVLPWAIFSDLGFTVVNPERNVV